MAKRHPLKITVLKKLSSKEVYGQPLPDVSEEMAPYCDRLEVGQEFVVEESGAMPPGFCTWAWHDIYPAVTGLRFGGNYPWMKREGLIYPVRNNVPLLPPGQRPSGPAAAAGLHFRINLAGFNTLLEFLTGFTPAAATELAPSSLRLKGCKIPRCP